MFCLGGPTSSKIAYFILIGDITLILQYLVDKDNFTRRIIINIISNHVNLFCPILFLWIPVINIDISIHCGPQTYCLVELWCLYKIITLSGLMYVYYTDMFWCVCLYSTPQSLVPRYRFLLKIIIMNICIYNFRCLPKAKNNAKLTAACVVTSP